jgi:formylmethanofuran dehydrogenase subunit B
VFTVAGPPPILNQQVPHILTGPNATLRQPSAHVAINTPVAGIETFGTVMRCDGVMLPLRALQNTSLPTDTAVLSCLLELLTP